MPVDLNACGLNCLRPCLYGGFRLCGLLLIVFIFQCPALLCGALREATRMVKSIRGRDIDRLRCERLWHANDLWRFQYFFVPPEVCTPSSIETAIHDDAAIGVNLVRKNWIRQNHKSGVHNRHSGRLFFRRC